MLTSLIPQVYQGALSPDALDVAVGQYDPADPDPSTATAAAIAVRAPNGEEFSWTASLTATPGTLPIHVTHPWVATDLTQKGDYSVVVELTLPGGVYRTAPRVFRVVDEFNASGPARGICRVTTVLA